MGPIEGWEKRGRRDAVRLHGWYQWLASDVGLYVCGIDFSRVIEAETKFSEMQSFPCILFKEKRKKCVGGFCDEGNGTEKELIGRGAKSEDGKRKNSSRAP